MKISISQKPGIYVHIPFCLHKCGYCDFFSTSDQSLRSAYLSALNKEINMYDAFSGPPPRFDTLYIGGGTPSLLSEAELDALLNQLHKKFSFTDDAEITLEINPGALAEDNLSFYHHAHINRLSVGVQSFFDNDLNFLERIHNAEQARQMMDKIRETGFDNISIDLIYAIPGQSIEQWQNNLRIALEFSPEHISAYNLTFEPGTPFHTRLLNNEIIAVNDNKEREFFLKTLQTLSDGGYMAYEISSFARSPAYISRHNYKYWNHSEYLGFGASAHSFRNNERRSNVRSLSGYIAKINCGEAPLEQMETVDKKTLEFEHIFLSLRTYRGLDLTDFRKIFGVSFPDKYSEVITPLVNAGFGRFNEHFFCLTPEGMLISDEIFSKFSDS